MKIALACAPIPASLNEGLYWLENLVIEAAANQVEIICFPESFLPGYPGMGYSSEDQSAKRLEDALNQVCRIAAQNKIAVIVPMDWHGNDGLLNIAHVVSANGEMLGYQTKNQLDPSEDNIWIPGTERKIFEVNGIKFGISICHEGFRYPETVRWAARNDAKIVFHPHFGGSNTEGEQLTEWGSMKNPYYEKAMMMRALENTIYFASVNYASRYPDSASSIIDPHGNCIAHGGYGKTGIVTAIIDPALATGKLAKRFKPSLYY